MKRVMQFAKIIGVLTLAAVAWAGPAQAATTYNWDVVPTNGQIDDGPGTWDTVTANWTTDGGNTNVVWSDGNNAVFGGGANGTAGTITVSGAVAPAGLTFNVASAGIYTLSNGTITIGSGGLTDHAAGTTTIASALALGAPQTWSTVSGGTLAISGGLTDNAAGIVTINSPVTLGTPQTWTAPTGTLAINGGLADTAAGSVAISALAVTVGAAQTWSTVSGGTLAVNGSIARSTGAALAFAGGGGFTCSGLPADGTGIVGPWTTVGSGASTQYVAAGSGSVGGYTGTTAASPASMTDTSGTANYELTGAGALTQSVTANTLRYSGSSGTISTDTLSLNGLMNVGSGPLTIASNMTIGANKELVVNTAGNGVTITSGIPDNGGGASALTEFGGGMLTLAGNNTYSGPTSVGGGTLQIGNGGSGAAISSASSASVALSNGAALVFDHSDNMTVGSVISGNGSLTQTGSGTLTLTGNNTYSGSTYVSGGTLQIGNGGSGAAISSASVTLSNSAALVFNHSDNVTFGAVISGTGSLTQAGGGTLRLTNHTNTYSGGTTVLSGTLNPVVPGIDTFALGGSLTMANGTTLAPDSAGATLVITASDSITLSGGTATFIVNNAVTGANGDVQIEGAVSGAGAMIVTGSNNSYGRRLELVGSNTFNGGVTVQNTGTTNVRLEIYRPTSLGSGTLTWGLLPGTSGGLEVGNSNVTSAYGFQYQDLSLGSGVTNAIELQTGANLNVTTVQNSIVTSGNLQLSGVISGAGSLTKYSYSGSDKRSNTPGYGLGTLYLTGANTYTGATTIDRGA